MSGREHTYSTRVTWTGNPDGGTTRRNDHSRNHEIAVDGKPVIPASSDPAFRGDASRYNPEDLFVASLSACHMLWYLSLCGRAGIEVRDYVDQAEGVMVEDAAGGGQFTRVVLRPTITLAAGADAGAAEAIHHEAHAKCFIAQSVSCPVTVEATYREG
jgi:organic hydroperoxide reductase OsmC/OhrA